MIEWMIAHPSVRVMMAYEGEALRVTMRFHGKTMDRYIANALLEAIGIGKDAYVEMLLSNMIKEMNDDSCRVD